MYGIFHYPIRQRCPLCIPTQFLFLRVNVVELPITRLFCSRNHLHTFRTIAIFICKNLTTCKQSANAAQLAALSAGVSFHVSPIATVKTLHPCLTCCQDCIC